MEVNLLLGWLDGKITDADLADAHNATCPIKVEWLADSNYWVAKAPSFGHSYYSYSVVDAIRFARNHAWMEEEETDVD